MVHFIHCYTTAVIIISIMILAAEVLLLQPLAKQSFQVPHLLQMTGGRSIVDSCHELEPPELEPSFVNLACPRSPLSPALVPPFPFPKCLMRNKHVRSLVPLQCHMVRRVTSSEQHLHVASLSMDLFLQFSHFLH